MVVYYTKVGGKFDMFDYRIIGFSQRCIAYKDGMVRYIDNDGYIREMKDIQYAELYNPAALIKLKKEQKYVTAKEYLIAHQGLQYNSIKWITDMLKSYKLSSFYISNGYRFKVADIKTGDRIADIYGIYKLNLPHDLYTLYELSLEKAIYNKLRNSELFDKLSISIQDELYNKNMLATQKMKGIKIANKETSLDLDNYIWENANSTESMNLSAIGLRDFILKVGKPHFCRYNNTDKTKYFDYIDIEIAISFGMPYELQMETVKRYRNEIDAIVLRKLNEDDRFRAMEIPINVLKAERVLTRDSRVIYKLSLKDELDS